MHIGKPRTDMLPACVRCMHLNTPAGEQPCNECCGLNPTRKMDYFYPSNDEGAPVSDLAPERKRTPAEVALNSITAVLDEAKRGQWKPADALQWIQKIVEDYFEESPIPYELTRKAGDIDD